MVVFDDVIFSQERLKNSFITFLTSWTGLIYEGRVLYCKFINAYSLVFLVILPGW